MVGGTSGVKDPFTEHMYEMDGELVASTLALYK